MCDLECESRVFDVVFLYALKPAEHTISAFLIAYLKEYLVLQDILRYMYLL